MWKGGYGGVRTWTGRVDGKGGGVGEGWGGMQSDLKSQRTWIPVCHANCSHAIECGHREQKVHRTPGILMQSLSEPSPSALPPPPVFLHKKNIRV